MNTSNEGVKWKSLHVFITLIENISKFVCNYNLMLKRGQLHVKISLKSEKKLWESGKSDLNFEKCFNFIDFFTSGRLSVIKKKRLFVLFIIKELCS